MKVWLTAYHADDCRFLLTLALIWGIACFYRRERIKCCLWREEKFRAFRSHVGLCVGKAGIGPGCQCARGTSGHTCPRSFAKMRTPIGWAVMLSGLLFKCFNIPCLLVPKAPRRDTADPIFMFGLSSWYWDYFSDRSRSQSRQRQSKNQVQDPVCVKNVMM